MALLILLLIPLLLSAAPDGDSVLAQGATGSDIYSVQRRLRELGYLNYRPTGKFSDMTGIAVRTFQQVNGLPDDGQIGDETMQLLFSENAVRNTANPAFKKAVGRAYTGAITQKGELSAWETIDKKFAVGDVVSVLDYNTGETFNLKRIGGVNCAQVVTETAADYEKFTYVFGGDTWEHRTVLVTIAGVQYAASLFGMPTRTKTFNTSGMNGYTILYFNNSKTDVNSLSDEEHILAVTRAS